MPSIVALLTPCSRDCIKMPNGQHMMKTQVVMGEVNVNDVVTLEVNEYIRKNIQANHSATHLLDQALKDVLGSHVYQNGSQVTDKNIRFDFNHFENVKSEQLLEIERIIKGKINESLNIRTYELPIEQAKKEGCTAVFGEKYGSIVRIVNINEYSKEFCGGCHASNTSEIVDFAFTSIESKGSGIFRVEAVTKENIVEKIIENNKNTFDEFDHEAKMFARKDIFAKPSITQAHKVRKERSPKLASARLPAFIIP